MTSNPSKPWFIVTRIAAAGRTALALALVMLVTPSLVCAQEQRDDAAPAVEEEAEHANELALVIAGTRDTEEDETFFTLGLEYERRLSKRTGIIAEVEYLFDADRWIVAAPVVFRPARGVKVFAGPGLERADESGEERGADGPAEDAEDRATHFLLRIGAGYTFELAESYSIAPTISLDFVREDSAWARAVVFGVSVGLGF